MKHLEILVPAISLAALLLLGSCSKSATSPISELYHQGLALVSEMNEAVQSEAWISLFTDAPAVKEILSKAGQDSAVLDTGISILCDSFSPDCPENVQQFLEAFGAQVSEITIPDQDARCLEFYRTFNLV